MRERIWLRQRSRGMSFWSLLFLLGVAGFVALLAIRLLPVYIDHFKVEENLRSVAQEGNFDANDPTAVKRALERHWDIEDIQFLDYRDVRVVRVGDVRKLVYDYEARVHLFWNLDLVAHFKNDGIPLRGSAN